MSVVLIPLAIVFFGTLCCLVYDIIMHDTKKRKIFKMEIEEAAFPENHYARSQIDANFLSGVADV